VSESELAGFAGQHWHRLLGAALQTPQLTSSGSDTLGELLPGTLMLGMALDARKFAKVEGAKSKQGHKNCMAAAATLRKL